MIKHTNVITEIGPDEFFHGAFDGCYVRPTSRLCLEIVIVDLMDTGVYFYVYRCSGVMY